MYCNNNNRSRAAPARGIMALFTITLAMGLASMVSRAEAAPFAYVTNGDFTVSVIDTATKPPKVVATVKAPPTLPQLNDLAAAVTPDGTKVYAVGQAVSVIDAATNKVVAGNGIGNPDHGVAISPGGQHAYVTQPSAPPDVAVFATATNKFLRVISLGASDFPVGIAVTPDGKHLYVANTNLNNVLVIDIATSTVVATVKVGNSPDAVAITPDGKHVYVTNSGDKSVSVMDTATNTVVKTVTVGAGPDAVAITPDGKHVYVANSDNSVSVIATTSNTVVATVAVGKSPSGVAVTPDGKHVYIANFGSNNVSVIVAATNTVVATVAVGAGPTAVAIVPPPPGVPFLAFGAKIAIELETAPNTDTFNLQSHFTLSSTAPAIHPDIEPVKLQVGTFTTTIPPGSFTKQPDGSFTIAGVIDGVSLKAQIAPAGTLQYAFNASGTGASLTGTKNEVYVTLKIGNDSGVTTVTATITH